MCLPVTLLWYIELWTDFEFNVIYISEPVSFVEHFLNLLVVNKMLGRIQEYLCLISVRARDKMRENRKTSATESSLKLRIFSPQSPLSGH